MTEPTRLHLQDWAHAMAQDVKQAQACIHISALSCLPPRTSTAGTWPALWQSWLDAAARGVTVDLYLPAPLKSAGATVANRKTADDCARHGIKCHLIPGPQLLHCKSLVVDLRTVWIGSGNFTSAAAHHNHEGYMRHVSQDMASHIINRWKALT